MKIKNMMGKIHSGDRIASNGSGGTYPTTEGDFTGRVTCVHGTDHYCVERDDGRDGTGCNNRWKVVFYNEGYINLLITKKSLMNKVSTMMKKLLDKDTQTLVKAGFINGDLDLTTEGERALMTLLFTAYKKELVTLAQEQLDEEKADKSC